MINFINNFKLGLLLSASISAIASDRGEKRFKHIMNTTKTLITSEQYNYISWMGD